MTPEIKDRQRKSVPGEPRIRVLMVEDSLEIAQMVVALLSVSGRYQVTVVQDGIRGQRLAISQEWELLLTDLNLPGKDGLELIREVRLARPKLPILAMTGYTRPHYFATALENGADAVLSKPLERDEFLQTVERLSDRARRETDQDPGPSNGPAGGGVLAIGAFPGDVEVGCSGALLGHAALGHAVTVAVVCGGGEDATRSPGPALSERVAGRIPASFHLMDASGDTFADPDRTDSMQRWLSGLIRDIAPHTVYAPSAHEAQAARLTTHEAAVAATEGAVRSILGYQSPTATVDFRPGLFVNIGATLDKKVDLLALYLASVDRPELSEEFVRVQAQYWGRFARNRVVEPFEVIRRINAKDSASPL